jgi:hypothetical protein
MEVSSSENHRTRQFSSHVFLPDGISCPKSTWLVVLTILKNINQLGLLFPIYGKIKNVPNHQPAKASFKHHNPF